MSPFSPIVIDCPEWMDLLVDWEHHYSCDAEKVSLAIALSHENVLRETGGPFGAAIFERREGTLVSVGVNSVVRLNNCCTQKCWQS